MKRTILNKYDKNELQNLPIADFIGRVIVIMTEKAAEKAVDFLLSADILGVDTETKPAFKRGQHHKVALLQVSTRDTCFLFRLNLIGMCPPVIRLLQDTAVPKVGISLHDDLRMLQRRQEFQPGNFVELQHLVGDIGIEDLSLQKIYANLFGKKISKRQRLTNWEADVLNNAQKRYAALDAQACIHIYDTVMHLKETCDYELIKAEDPNELQEDISEER